MEPTIRTPGQKALRDWLDADPARSQGAIAKALGVSQPAVGYWVKGTSRPNAGLREALLALCGIPVADWELAEEREQRDAALARIAAGNGTGGAAA